MRYMPGMSAVELMTKGTFRHSLTMLGAVTSRGSKPSSSCSHSLSTIAIRSSSRSAVASYRYVQRSASLRIRLYWTVVTPPVNSFT
ncbi:hypothetical protein DMA15_23825 [Streptomyces sp. WAC 01529]|nr:hypothetical protein DMA15_23825 [Streptomyces sp. WAC 01529]